MAFPPEPDIENISFIHLLRNRRDVDGTAPCLYVIGKNGNLAKTITVAEFVQGVDRLSSWLDQHLEAHSEDGWDPIAYTGPVDVRYLMFPLAALQTGRLVSRVG